MILAFCSSDLCHWEQRVFWGGENIFARFLISGGFDYWNWFFNYYVAHPIAFGKRSWPAWPSPVIQGAESIFEMEFLHPRSCILIELSGVPRHFDVSIIIPCVFWGVDPAKSSVLCHFIDAKKSLPCPFSRSEVACGLDRLHAVDLLFESINEIYQFHRLPSS